MELQKSILVPLGIGICAALAILIPILISASKESVDAFVYASLSIYFIFSLLSAFYLARWKVEVTRDYVFFRPTFGAKRKHSMKDITKVVEKKSVITLYAGERKILKVSPGCDGFPILLERLESEGIPFEQR